MRAADNVTAGAGARALRARAVRRVRAGASGAVDDTDLRTAEIFHRIARTDDEAECERLRHEVTELNLPMARRVAARYVGRGESFEDLYQVACLALVKAVRNFDDSRDSAFGFYAIPSMHGEVKRHFRDHSWGIRPPRHIQDSRGGVNDAVQTLTQDLRRPPDVGEIVGATGLDAGTVRECLASNDLYRLSSIDAMPASGDAGGEVRTLDFTVALGDVDDRLESIEDRMTLRPLIERLSPRERRLLALRFVHEWTQAQIAREFGVSQVQVSRLLAKVLAGLRESLAAA